MRFFLVSHPALRPVLERILPASQHQLDTAYLEDFSQLPALLEQACGYDAVLLPDGVHALAGEALVARHAPLVIPRVHNCASLLLGGGDAYRNLFTSYNGGLCWALGDAQTTLHFAPPADCSCLCYLADTTLCLPDGSVQARLTARENNWDYFEAEMDCSLLNRLLSGDWDCADLLCVPKGGAVCPTCSRELLAAQD